MSSDFEEMPTHACGGSPGGSSAGARSGFAWGATPLEPIDRLGRGGMGEVWRALDTRLGREVAVKLLLGESRQLSDSGSRRFQREGEISAAMDHPHVLRVHEMLEAGGRLALVYELLEGARPLDQAWGHELADRVRLLIQLARGLEHAHAQGIVHRDLKPENILVDGAGQLRIADFGLAFRDSVERLTRSGAMIGTPYYMAPEQFRARGHPAPSVDVWSVGVLLHLALTDELPFMAGSLGSLVLEVQEGLPRAAWRKLQGSPRGLARLVQDCLRTEPAERPSAQAILETLEAWNPAGRPARRLWPALALGLAALVGVAGYLAWPPPAEDLPPASLSSVEATSPPQTAGAQPPPPELLEALRSPELARSGFAALDLLEGYAPGEYLEEARERVERLKLEPIQRLRFDLPSGVGKKDWEVGFVPGEPWDLIGLADGCGRVARWDLVLGSLKQDLDLKWEWHSGLVQPFGALASTTRIGAGSVLQFRHDGTRRRFLARTDPDFGQAHAMIWQRPEEVWVLASPNLIRFDNGQETLRVPLPTDAQSGNLIRLEDSLAVALVDAQSQTRFYLFDIAKRRFQQIATLEGDPARLDYEARRGRLVISSGIEFALLNASRERVFLSELPLDELRWKRVTWHPSGDWIWRWGEDPANPRRSELQLVSASDGALRARWQIKFKVGSAHLSPDGRFVAFGSADKARKGVAAEIYYLGKETWD